MIPRRYGDQSPALLVLAFDFGLKRIGIASGDTITGNASPLVTVNYGVNGPDWNAIAQAIKRCDPQLLLVGEPYNDDGTLGKLAAAATQFASQLAQRFAIPVERMDERYSSVEAAAQLREQRASGQRKRRMQRGDIDSAAAAVVLTSWLRAHND
ncbi:MAG: Holliday junction resolvase RuvX [Steroidobacteraceae bacterium]